MVSNREIFEKGKSYLLSFNEINQDMLNKQLSFPTWSIPKTKTQLFRKMIEHAQNRQGMPNSIGNIDNLYQLLFDFDSDILLLNHDNWSSLFDSIKLNYTPPGRMDKANNHNYWVIFCKSIISIAMFLRRFKNIEEFNSYVNQFITNIPDTRLALPLILKEEIFGYKFALACDFVKENISPYFIKPDTHIRDIFIGLGISNSNASDFQIFRDALNYSESINEIPYSVDKLFWLIGSGNFYYEDIQIKSSKHEFIKMIKKNS